MCSKDPYRSPLEVLKVSQPNTTSATKIDLADLEALEGSFTDDATDGSSLMITQVKHNQRSPVRIHNKQFEDDFDIDLSEEEDIIDIRLTKQPVNPNSKLTPIIKEFSSPPSAIRLTERLKIPQPNQTVDKKPLPPIGRVSFESDFEDSLESDFDELLTAKVKHEEKSTEAPPVQASSAAESFVFTSSPSYHRYETFNRKGPESATTAASGVPAPEVVKSTESKNLGILDSFDEHEANDLLPSLSEEQPKNDLYPQLPPIHSTPKDSVNLYPSMDSYSERNPIEQPIEAQTERVKHFFDDLKVGGDPEQAKQSGPRKFFDGLKSKGEVEVHEGKSFLNAPKFKEPRIIRESTPRSSNIPSLLSKPKKRNAEILLLTQRPQIHEMGQTRHASTTTRPESPVPAHIKTVQPFSLSEEQQHVIDLAKRGLSLFYTGSAGTGKSVLLRTMIKTLKQMHPPGTVAVTASTGLAACNIGGITLHSFAGIGLGKESVTDLVKKIRRSKKNGNRWKNVKVLVIDEISMIDGELFDKLDEIARRLRRCEDPFGGIQLIVCGDFFQLPPVSRREEQPATFAFDSEAWKRSIKLTITLQQVFRQKGDMEFITMLNEMRIGKLSSESIRKFRELERELPESEIEPAELYCTRYEVERANKTRLDKLENEIKTYTAWDGGLLEDQQQRERLLSNFLAPQRLHLKKGAQVMMIKNIDDSLVNGSLGKVIDFIDQETYLTYDKITKDYNLENSEIEKDIERVKEENETKPKDELEDATEKLEDTVFDFFNEIDSNDPDVQRNIQMKKQLMNSLHENSRGRKLPLVRFTTPEGQIRCVLVHPETWDIEDEHEKPLVTRMQIPLILAWALSIHKSQGQTLPRVRVNLRNVFEKGQAYVALSRAVNRGGLQVLHFDARKVVAHKRVIELYSKLKSAQDAKKQLEETSKARNLLQGEVDSAMSGSNEYLDEQLEEDEEYVDAPSPSSFLDTGFGGENGEFVPIVAADDSSDNIVLNRRNFRKRGSEYL